MAQIVWVLMISVVALTGCGDDKPSEALTGPGTGETGPGVIPGIPGIPGGMPMPDGMPKGINTPEGVREMFGGLTKIELTDERMEAFFAFSKGIKENPANSLALAKKYGWSIVTVAQMATKFGLVKALMDHPERADKLGLKISPKDVALIKKWMPKWEAMSAEK